MYLFLISILFYKAYASYIWQGMLYATFENEGCKGCKESHI